MNQAFIENAVAGVMAQSIATGLFVSLATFQAPSQDFDSAGAWDGTWSDIAGLVDIPCTAPPVSESRISATENRELSEIVASEWLHVMLDAYYPTLDEGWRGDGTPAGAWRILVDAKPYEIQGVESDSQSQMTRVTARVTTI